MADDADVVLTTYGTAVRDVEALATVDWHRVVLDEAQAIKNPASEVAQRAAAHPRPVSAWRSPAPRSRTGSATCGRSSTSPIPGLVGPRPAFIQQLSTPRNGSGAPGEAALRALNGLLVFRRTKAEPEIAAELPDKIDELDHCGMTAEQIGLYQAVLDNLLGVNLDTDDRRSRKGHVLAAITRAQADLRPPRRIHRRRRRTARGPVGQARSAGGAGRQRVRRRGAHAGVHPLRPLGRAPGRAPDQADRRPHRLLPRWADPGHPRPHGAASSRRRRAREPWCCRSRPAGRGST